MKESIELGLAALGKGNSITISGVKYRLYAAHKDDHALYGIGVDQLRDGKPVTLGTIMPVSHLLSLIARMTDEEVAVVKRDLAPVNNGWHCVKDELPDFNEKVLLYKYGVLQTATFYRDKLNDISFWTCDNHYDYPAVSPEDWWMRLRDVPLPPL